MSLIYLSPSYAGRRTSRLTKRRGGRPWSQAVFVGALALGGALLLFMAEGLRDPTAASDLAAPAASADLAGRPTRITDGDTFRLGEVRVRLHGVDAPELRTADGPLARRHLAAVVGSGAVRCDDTGERSYDRVVATCWSASGRELGAAMVADGWALDAPRFSGGRYAAAERAARAARRGMHAAG